MVGKASQDAQELMGWGEHRCCSTGEMAASDAWAAEKQSRGTDPPSQTNLCPCAKGCASPGGGCSSGGLAGIACGLEGLQSSAEPDEHVHRAHPCHGAYVQEDLAAKVGPWIWGASSWLSLSKQS